MPSRCLAAVALVALLGSALLAQEAPAPGAYRKAGQAVEPVSDTTLVCEAEEFHVATPGWQARPWSEAYFCATFANSFLSRKAFLGAPEQCDRTTATIAVRVPKAGRYLALVRYEACHRFETQFRLRVEQNGATKLDRLYGARSNVKLWAFREGLKPEVAWSWGAVENVVWEGHDAFVELAAGPATLTLIADRQPEPAAQRHVDLVLLTSDVEQVKTRIAKENYLPLDGMLTQAGDVYLKVHNAPDGAALTLTVPPGTEHSPYWVHVRNWKPLTLRAEPGQSTDWVEVGSLLDSLNDGQWNLAAKGNGQLRYALECGVRGADGAIMSMRRFEGLTGSLELAYDADTRRTRRIRTADAVLHDLVAYLQQQPVQGTPPRRTVVYGYTFTPRPGDDRYNAAIETFTRLVGATALTVGSRNEIPADGLVRGYIDVRSVPTPKLEELCKKLQAEGKAERIAVVSLGDEIGLAMPPATDHAGLRTWLQGQGLKPSDLGLPADDWDKVMYSPAAASAQTAPALFYHSRRYAYRFGIARLKERTDILRRYLPHAGVGANFSPHHGPAYLGSTHQWISLFREGGMTMPWGEDYIWGVPVGSQQMTGIMLDMFRAALRDQPGGRIHFYVMPHWPGNTPNSWRRQFYTALGHGAKVLNLFEFRPVQAAYTENHVSLPAMYQEVRRGLHELGPCEDIVQDGRVRPAQAALWFSEAADVWDDNRSPFDVAKRCLYAALRRDALPLDVVVEGDDLKPYRVLYLTDRHVSRPASRAIADWVRAGGRLFATAGAGMFDDLNQPNTTLRALLGVDPKPLEEAPGEPIRWEKQDLPFAEPFDTVRSSDPQHPASLPVFGVRSRVRVTAGEARFHFGDGTPAVVVNPPGQGQTIYCGFLPGLTYLKPAIPRRPVDRGTTDDAMAHLIPTTFDEHAAALIHLPAESLDRPVRCSERLIDATLIEAKQGAVIPLVNWSKGPVRGLRVTVAAGVPGKHVTLASGRPVQVVAREGALVCTLDLDVADALILRP